MSDILDALDAINGAEALVKEWEREFLHEWYRPLAEVGSFTGLRQRHPKGAGVRAQAGSRSNSEFKKKSIER